MKFKLTDDIEQFMTSKGMKICYSDVEIDGYWIRSSKLLLEDSIREFDVQFNFDKDHFLLDGEDFFDPLAASFYLVSRYEEYLPFKPDDHGRFPATSSVLHKYQQLKTPLVNQWALALKYQLTDFYPNLLFNPREFSYISTIDIDQAFKYKHKGWQRNIGGLLRDIGSGDWSLVKERLAILSNKRKDPFDNFDWQKEIHKEKKISVNYFVQVGDRGEFDKNLDVDVPEFQNIIKSLDETQSIGIHPSYASNSNAELVTKEKRQLESVLGHELVVSRQHFLKMRFPETFQGLIENGITEDHTLGYSTNLGFRAGIAAPFMFFDLSTNRETSLKLVPFCMMDITPLHYYEQGIQEAKIELTQMVDRIKRCGGLCVSLWHNESLSKNGKWTEWRDVYEHLLNQSTKK
jgi:hypothetical protein